jgi:hypothetical protein
MIPVWLLQVFHVTKSFEENPLLGSPLLNRLGLHVARVVLAHGVMHFRTLLLSPLVTAEDRAAFRRDGFLVKRDFLPPETFAALVREVRQFDGAEARECVQGDTVNRRTPLDPETLHGLPACCELLQQDRTCRRLLQWTAATLRPPFVFVEQLFHAHRQDDRPDPQKHLHSDTFHPTMKGWLFLEDVPAEKGPFSYVARSHRLTFPRLRWEYRQSIAGRRLPDRYSRKGSLRLNETDRVALGLPEPTVMAVPGNTLVIANTFGFHARGSAPDGSTRLALYADSRTNPFVPLPGIDLPWIDALQYRLLKRQRVGLDEQAARRGEQSSWHLVREQSPKA